MGDNINYKHGVFKTVLKPASVMPGEFLLEPDLPFTIYGMNIVSLGEDVTYRMRDVSLNGAEVMCKVEYRISDEAKAKSYAGWLGDDPQAHLDYAKHYPVTKAEKYPGYIGLDKDTPAKFCWWGEMPIPILAIKMVNSDIVSDDRARMHADLLDDRDADDVESKGFVVDGIYYTRVDYNDFLKEYIATNG